MLPTEARVKELQERFGVSNGRFFGEYRLKNLNWFLAKRQINAMTDEWFCFGDIRNEDIPRLQDALEPEEFLVLGWKDLGRDSRDDEFFGNGGGVWLIITEDDVPFDKRRDQTEFKGF